MNGFSLGGVELSFVHAAIIISKAGMLPDRTGVFSLDIVC